MSSQELNLENDNPNKTGHNLKTDSSISVLTTAPQVLHGLVLLINMPKSHFEAFSENCRSYIPEILYDTKTFSFTSRADNYANCIKRPTKKFSITLITINPTKYNIFLNPVISRLLKTTKFVISI